MPAVLCLLAHPDDEIFCADLLARLTEEGHTLHFACLTRGGGGRHYGDPPRATTATLGVVREQEMRSSAEVLGANGVTFLDYVDPPSTDGYGAPEHDRDELVEDIRALIEKRAPALVVTHGSGGEYGHPAHRLVHESTSEAIATGLNPRPALYSFNAYHSTLPELNILNRWDWADLRLDASPYAEAKARALRCHRTQWTAFVGPQNTVEDYRGALVDHVASLPAETYCCHRTGHANVSPAVLSTWVEGLEPVRGHSGETLRDATEKYRHKARIAAGEGVLTLRQHLRRWFNG
jgi:LmbE family N-acetylglucosaminyl deacetylase